LADADKRPGSRDISDLKARLGLKKGGAAAPGKKGVVPPPGTRGGAVPPPPGVEPPRPKASDDPFGALNQAAQARPAPAPEIIVVEKGGTEHKIERRGLLIRLAITAAVALATMIVGCFVGGVGKNNAQYNRVIADSGKMAEEVGKARKSISGYELVFKRSIEDRKELIDALDKVKYEAPDTEVFYKSWLYELETELVGDTLTFAQRSNQLAVDMRAHIDQTRKDFDLLKKVADNIKAVQPKETENKERYSAYRFAIMLSIPTDEEEAQGKQFGATFVEIDLPICADTKQASPNGECSGERSGFRYRADPNQAWKDGQLAPKGAAVPGDKLVPLLPSGVINVLAATPGPTLAEQAYAKRDADLRKAASDLVQLGTYIEGKLEAKSRESTRFTFFM
jgi:hypothetical protein